MQLLPPLLAALVVGAGGGHLYLRWAREHALDVPNARSSHSRPVPRGGGLAIILGFFAGLAVWLTQPGAILSPRALGWLAGSLLVAAVSFVDDLHPLPALPRLITHLLGALLLTAAGVQQPEPGIIVLAFVYVVVLTNIYNFMDGIDGLATSQAIIAGCGLAIGGLMVGNPLLSVGGSLLAAASLGFLAYNHPPAKLFMGDVGSTFLGFSFAGLPLLASIGVGGRRLPIEFALVLLAPFLFDSLLTLARRVVVGERWYAPHRSHYYQRLVGLGLTHGQVTSLYAALAAIAALTALALLGAPDVPRPVLLLLGYAPMLGVLVLVWRLERAEKPNRVSTVVTQGPG
jgi:UDP-N-acetylmuramyl pentapeptide phosphotransferase/UDP-N-acetylglucosamine-1-phosphate transferase